MTNISPEALAIKDLSLKINPGQKLIVCGRTGRFVTAHSLIIFIQELTIVYESGKSTLLLTLLRLLELQSGRIKLDGIDIKRVNLNLLRQRCFIAVSQDPLILPEETLRFNLDPDTSSSDQMMIDALTKVGLWSHFVESDKRVEGNRGIANSGLGEHSILDQKISLLQDLSVGQCQLFSICRALLKATALRATGMMPVVVLDEVTSSLDVATESTIYRIVDEELMQKGQTVIIVSHRLGSLRMKDRRDAVAVMAEGRLLEVRKDLERSNLGQLARTE